MLAMALLASGAEPEQGQLDASQTLFTVMAAINAAGYKADLSSPNNHPLRRQVTAEILRRNPPSLPAIREFFERHRQPRDTTEISQYVSFALSVKGPPDFLFAQRDVELPPDVAPLRSLAPLLAAFYHEANIDELWKRSQPAIDEYIARYHQPVAEAVLQVNAYLRQATSGFRGLHFQVVIELLGGPNQVQMRSYGANYTIVVTPSPEPRIFDVRHAYLHYLLEPLSMRNRDVLARKQGIGEHALRAQALDESFRDDFPALTTECLIKAIEARLDRKPDGIGRALLQGFILTPYFAEALPAYEKQEQSMAVYYPDMIKAIDLRKEDDRLVKVEFDKQAAQGAVVRPAGPVEPPPATGAAKTLEEAEQLYAERTQDPATLEKAKLRYLAVLEQTDNKTLHAAAYYGVARIAALQKDPEAAQRLFRKALELGPEPRVKAWTLVYLGRLALAAGDGDEAKNDFEEALKVDGAPEQARKAATEGLQVKPKQ